MQVVAPTMVIVLKSPKDRVVFFTPSEWPLSWLINGGGYPEVLTKWDDPPSRGSLIPKQIWKRPWATGALPEAF